MMRAEYGFSQIFHRVIHSFCGYFSNPLEYNKLEKNGVKMTQKFEPGPADGVQIFCLRNGLLSQSPGFQPVIELLKQKKIH